MANGNCDLNFPYTDQYCWLMVFTPDLNFKFDPVRFDKYPAHTWFTPYTTDTSTYILCYHSYFGTDTVNDFIALYDTDGKVVDKKIIPFEQEIGMAHFCAPNERNGNVRLVTQSGEVFQIDKDLEYKKIIR